MKKVDVAHGGVDGFDVNPTKRVEKNVQGVAITSPGSEDIGSGMDTQGMGPGADIAMNEKKIKKLDDSFDAKKDGLPKGFSRWHTLQGREYKHSLGKAKGHFESHNLGKHEDCSKTNLTCSEVIVKSDEKQEPQYGGELKKEHIGFQALENKLAHKPGITNPAAVAASIGRKKYGAKRMAESAAKGKPANKVHKTDGLKAATAQLHTQNKLLDAANKMRAPKFGKDENLGGELHTANLPKSERKLTKEEWIDVAKEGDPAERLFNPPGTEATKVPASVDNPKAKKLKQGVDPKRTASGNDQMTPEMQSEVKKNAMMGYGAPSARMAAMPNPSGSPATAKKVEPLSKPPVSQDQRAAMGAAASGHSTLGIPKKVGQHFIDKDPGGKLPAHKAEVPMAKPPTGTASKPTAAPKMAVKQPSLGKEEPGINEEGVPNKYSKEFEKDEGMGMAFGAGAANLPGSSMGQEPAVNGKSELHKCVLPGAHLPTSRMHKSGMPWGGAGIKPGSGTPAGVVPGPVKADTWAGEGIPERHEMMSHPKPKFGMADLQAAKAKLQPKIKLPQPSRGPAPKLPGLTPPKMGKSEVKKAHPSEMEMDEEYHNAGDPNQDLLTAVHDSTVSAKPGLGLSGHKIMGKGYDPKVYLPIVRAMAAHGMSPKHAAEFMHSKAGRFAGDELSNVLGANHPEPHKALSQHIKAWQKWKAKNPHE